MPEIWAVRFPTSWGYPSHGPSPWAMTFRIETTMLTTRDPMTEENHQNPMICP